jgi:methyl-accepting chemotaxis protein
VAKLGSWFLWRPPRYQWQYSSAWWQLFFFGLRRLHAKIKEIEGRARSHGPTVAKMAADLGEALGSLKRVTNNVAEISQRIKSTVNGAADLSGRLFIGADHVIDDAVTRVERISDTVEHGIARPVRELQAILAALRANAEHILTPQDRLGRAS